MNKPLISIVICCHNRRHLLEQTMETVFAQVYEPVEIIIQDDGSTDGTDKLMASYGDKVRYQWQEGRGSAAARNAACQRAKGEYIAFHDDDDLMLPHRVSHLYQALCQYPDAVFITAGYGIIDTEGKQTGKTWCPPHPDGSREARLIEDAYRAIMWPEIPANPCTTLFRRADGERIGWLDTDFRYAASDKDFYARLALLGPVVYLPEVVYYLRRGHSSIWSNDLRARYCNLQLLEKHLRLIEAENRVMYKRLQQRLLQTLRGIAGSRKEGMSENSPEFDKLEQRGLSLLDAKERFQYQLYTRVKLPIRQMIRGVSTAKT